MTPIHLLLATDGSEPSLAAARLVGDLLHPAALARVMLLAVVAPLDTTPCYGGFASFGGGVVSQEAWDEMTTAAERAAQEAMRRTVTELQTTVPIESMIRHGSPAAEIVRYTDKIGAGLIVMGSRGWGEMHAMLLGSTSKRVLHTASCPVLIVRSSETRPT